MTTGESTVAKVLVIDDEPAVRKLLRIILEEDGYDVLEAGDGRKGLAEAACGRPDVIILDLGLPDIEGLEVLKHLREWNRTPLLVLSVREDVDDKVAALDLGADDYLTKPFHGVELLARLRAIRRHAQTICGDPVYQCGGLEIDFVARAVKIDRKLARLTPTEYALLRILILHRGKVVTHRQLLREVWGPQADERSQYLRVYANRLRKKICPDPNRTPRILNEPGIGYRFVE